MIVDFSIFEKKEKAKKAQKKKFKVTFGVTVCLIISFIFLLFVGLFSFGSSVGRSQTSVQLDFLSTEQLKVGAQGVGHDVQEDFVLELIKEVDTEPFIKKSEQKKQGKEAKQSFERNYAVSSYVSRPKQRKFVQIVESGEKLKVKLLYGFSSTDQQPITAAIIQDSKSFKLKSSELVGYVSGFDGEKLKLSFSMIRLKDGRSGRVSGSAIGLDNAIGVRANVKENTAHQLAHNLSGILTFGSDALSQSIGASIKDQYIPAPDDPIATLEKGKEFFSELILFGS